MGGASAFGDIHRLLIEPALVEDARVRYVVFVGVDGYRSIVAIEDALADNVLLADRLDGQPLTPDHGAPVRLVDPDQYGFISTKHLSRIELLPGQNPPASTTRPRASKPLCGRSGRTGGRGSGGRSATATGRRG